MRSETMMLAKEIETSSKKKIRTAIAHLRTYNYTNTFSAMALATLEEDYYNYGSSTNFILMLLSKFMGFTATLVHPNNSITSGTSGCLILYFLTFIFFGIPLLYMELTVSQFTARDCLDVWKTRACLSHIGYIQLVWQVIALIYNHAMVTFIVHYLLISFENPIPYTRCGVRSTPDCEIIKTNFSVNNDCMRRREPLPYCEDLYTTFAEYQYWRYNFLGGSEAGINVFHIAWKATLASGLICIIVYLHCFKRFRSLQYFLRPLIVYPFAVYTLFLLCTMRQKGIISHYEMVLDTDFSMFVNKVKVSSILQQVVFSLGLGTGVAFNLSARTAFRSACYKNAVIATVAAAAFTLLTVSTTAMMSCPYASENGMKSHVILNNKLNMAFEKLPRIVSHFENPIVYFILLYSCLGCVGIGTDVVWFFTLSEMVMKRFEKLSRYPGLVNFIGVFLLFVVSIPWIGSFGINFLQSIYKYQVSLITSFLCIAECIVFVFWYGFDRFSEDIHFMQGTQPKPFLKVGWLLSVFVYAYVFCSEVVQYSPFTNRGSPWGFFVLIILVGGIVGTSVVRILVALCRRRFREEVQLDSSWGPRSDVLQRSRAMFTAQAMTKEYLYRQYHLQAGIVARQRRSNVRPSRDFHDRSPSPSPLV